MRTLNAAFAAHTKITALEKVLQQHDPALLLEYQKALAEIEQNPPFLVNPSAISNLPSTLVQG
jgi:hypothetical protein